GPYPSRVDGTEGLVLALALRGRGHDFAGVAVVVVPVKTLQRAVDQVELGTHGVASVRTADLQLVQHRDEPAGGGDSIYLGPESALRKAVQAAPESGLYRATNDADAIERLVAYRRLSSYPLYVQAGEDLGDNLVRWRRNSALGLVLILCFAAASGLMLRATTIRQREYERAERLAREQAAMLDTDLIGIIRLRERKVAWANRGAELIFGYARGALVGRPVRGAYPDEESFQRARQERLHAMAERGYSRIQRQVMRQDGSLTWIDESARLLSDDVDDQLVVIVDIGPLKQAEEARAQAAQLQAQNVQLREVNQQKSVFLANMSHELRTPLNAIMGFGGLLERDPNLSPKVRDWAAKIGESGRHLLALIDNVLDVSRLETGQLEVRTEAVALAPVIEACLGRVGARAASRGVELVAAGSGCALSVRADRGRLEQVLVHLLSNAIKFNRVDGRVEVSCGAAGAWLRVAVSDTGAGLDAAQRARLFAPFERLDADRLYVEGTGIGLALSKRLIEAMGGRIGVDSTPGSGSTFWIELQLIDESPAGTQRPACEPGR
ncbi:MAG: PAS domain S-box protein, partial [Burkholderiales bacterium]|nr:PAS domain S-box protein [Burkholderiales bacterium]